MLKSFADVPTSDGTLGEIAEDVDWLMKVLAFLCSLIGIQLCMKKKKE